jgi:hypothetical protein
MGPPHPVIPRARARRDDLSISDNRIQVEVVCLSVRRNRSRLKRTSLGYIYSRESRRGRRKSSEGQDEAGEWFQALEYRRDDARPARGLAGCLYHQYQWPRAKACASELYVPLRTGRPSVPESVAERPTATRDRTGQ